MGDIKHIVCENFGIPVDCLSQKIRVREILIPRQVYVTLCVENGYSNSESGRSAVIDHATVLHARKSVSNLYDTDSDFRTKMQIIRLRLKQI